METSKKLVWLSWGVALTLTAIVVICDLFSIPCSEITTVTSYSWAEVAAANIFYYTMVKRLNAPKVVMGISKGFPRQRQYRCKPTARAS